jgi:hypothetical protein
MGMVFFVGEWFGGIILHYDDRLDAPLKHVLVNLFKKEKNSYLP